MARITKAQAELNAANEAAVKEAQRVELARLRKAKRDAKKAADAKLAAHVEAVQPEVAHLSINDMLGDYDIELPSARRVLVGFVLGLMSSCAVGYGIGMLLSYALAGIIVLTSTPWIAFVLSVLAWVLAIYAAWKVAGYVGGKVFSSVVMPEGLASRSYASVVNAVSGGASRTTAALSDAQQSASNWFARSKDITAEAFSGAHSV